jgi:hypothetical protein
MLALLDRGQQPLDSTVTKRFFPMFPLLNLRYRPRLLRRLDACRRVKN